jgi:hypothetical protein
MLPTGLEIIVPAFSHNMFSLYINQSTLGIYPRPCSSTSNQDFHPTHDLRVAGKKGKRCLRHCSCLEYKRKSIINTEMSC